MGPDMKEKKGPPYRYLVRLNRLTGMTPYVLRRAWTHPDKFLLEMSSLYPAWARWFNALLHPSDTAPQDPEPLGEGLLFPARGLEGPLREAALVPRETPYGIYYFGYVLGLAEPPYEEDATYVFLPASLDPKGQLIPPYVAPYRGWIPGRVHPLGKVLAVLGPVPLVEPS